MLVAPQTNQSINFSSGLDLHPLGQPLNTRPTPATSYSPTDLHPQNNLTLDEASRTKLDGIVHQMQTNGETDNYIQNVVNDFKLKYGTGADTSSATAEPAQPWTVQRAIANPKEFMQGVGSDLTKTPLISAESGFGQDIAAAAANILPASWTGVQQLNQANQQHAINLAKTASLISSFSRQGEDTTKLRTIFRNEVNNAPPALSALYPALNKTNWQVVGDAAGTLADILSAGSYGVAVKGAETGKLLTTVAKGTDVLPAAKATVGQSLTTIGKQTAARSATGAGIGYGYDVAGNLQNGKTGVEALTPGAGTLAGAAVPALVGGVRAGVTISKERAPRFINSLINPREADFSYGKDPGRTVAAMGITGNSLPDFITNIRDARQNVGAQIGGIISSPENATLKINVAPDVAKIDTAIAAAAKGGRSNQSVVTALQNAKDALLYEHHVNTEGVIEKTGTTPRDLSALSPQEAFDLKQLVSSQTKFTGNPSDDRAVNSTLQSVYGGIKEKINNAVGINNPEITNLNQRYADLTSAEIATVHRDQIVSRSNIISMPVKVGSATGIITAFATGGATIPAILAGAGTAALDKAMQSTAVKSRIAAWLGKETPGVIADVISKNPAIRTVLQRALPRFASQLGQSAQ